jgi:DNA-binding NarL/FixJ family response regulator
MFYRELAEVANNLNDERLDIDELLQSFCLRDIAARRLLASFFLQVSQEGKLELLGFFGASPDSVGLTEQSLSVFSDHPAASSIRTNSMVWVSWKPEIVADFSTKLELVAWPIHSSARTVGALLTLMESKAAGDEEVIECLEAFSEVVGSALVRKLDISPKNGNNRISHNQTSAAPANNHGKPLTERQLLILKLIAEGRTNGDIADALGYSESLIRQETIRIYASLGCNGRSDATEFYKKNLLRNNEINSKSESLISLSQLA